MKFSPFIFVLLFFISCAHVQKDKTLNGLDKSEDLIKNAKISFEKAYFAKSRNDKVLNAKKGIIFSEECINKYPNKAGCYYFRAVNTGLFYEARIIGYQKGIKQMINDSKKVIEIDPNYENAGAYLMLGQIYSQVPITTARQGDIKRDLNLADEYLSKAVSLSPNYIENLLYSANIKLEMGEIDLAQIELLKALNLLKKYKGSPYYEEWKKLANDIKKELRKNGID